VPDAIWNGLIGALIAVGGALCAYFWFVQPRYEREVALQRSEVDQKAKRAGKKDQRDSKQVTRLLDRDETLGPVSGSAETLAKALHEADAQLVELSREVETHEVWLRLARVARQLPKHVRRVTLNTVRKRGQEQAETYRTLCECLALPEMDVSEKARWDELSSKERRSLLIHSAIHSTHENLVADMLQLGMLSMSGMIVQSEITDYMISDDEVDAYILDWAREGTSEDFLERTLEEPKDSTLAEATRQGLPGET
jgi:hypothetical protein